MILEIHLAIVCAKLITIYTALTFLLMSRKIISKLPIQFINAQLHNSETYIKIHYILLVNTITLSIIHTIAHYVTFASNNTEFTTLVNFLSNASIFTGNTLLFIVILVIPTLRLLTRRSNYYLWIHHTFIVTFSIVLISHGCFCYLKLQDGSCRNPQSWKWLLIPVIIYTIDLIWRYNIPLTTIQKITVYNKNILEIKIDKRPDLEKTLGTTIYINCPQISNLEWHPFSIASTRFDENYTTFYIKERGNWTESLHKLMGKTNSSNYIPIIYPQIKIDGSYGDKFYNIEKILSCHNVCMYSLGIGVTPFISVFKCLVHLNFQIKNLLIVLTIRDIYELDIIHDLLTTLCNKYANIKIYIYETNTIRTTITFDNSLFCSNRICIYNGRPNLQHLEKTEMISKLFKIS